MTQVPSHIVCIDPSETNVALLLQHAWRRMIFCIREEVDPGCCIMGKQPLLSLAEEANIVIHLKEMAAIGFGYTRQEVADMATDLAIQLNQNSKMQD